MEMYWNGSRFKSKMLLSEVKVKNPNIQGGARNVIPFYHPIKIVISWY